MKATRNKTINISPLEGEAYLSKCISVQEKTTLNQINNKTIIGDTLNTLPLLPNNIVDLLIVDPPYNLHKKFHGNNFKRIDDDSYAQYTESWIKLIKPLLKEDASIYVCCDWQSSIIIGTILKQHFKLQNRITWQREKGRGARNNWKNAMEDIWFVTNSKSFTFNVEAVKLRRKVLAPYKVKGTPKDWEETKHGKFRNTFPSNFWDDISIPYWSMPENTAHPTQKPEKLIAKLILASSNEGDVVLDPFLGSGTTSVVAKKLKRNYIGIEHNEQYCIWAEKRLEMAEHDPSIQGYTDDIFWERNTGNIQKRLKAKSKSYKCQE